MKPPITYRLLKQYVKLGLTVYFKKWQSVNARVIPDEGPFIFVANHQNAFLDALLVVCGIKRNPWFLARGDVFKKAWAIQILTFFRIKPVFRFRDGHGAMRRNEQIIEECLTLLENNECVLLFAEGNHNEPWTFQNLQRGFAHIAIQYVERTKKDIQLIPVGFHYEDHDAFRSRVLVNYGEPISLQEAVGDISEIREKFIPLIALTAEKLKSLILTIPLDENYEQRKFFLKENRVFKKDMLAQLEADRQLMSNWTKESKGNPEKKNRLLYWLNPLTIYGRVTHLIPHLLTHYVVTKKIKDNQFIGSIKLTLGIFIIPLYYILISILFYAGTHELLWALGFMISLPVSGVYAYDQG